MESTSPEDGPVLSVCPHCLSLGIVVALLEGGPKLCDGLLHPFIAPPQSVGPNEVCVHIADRIV